MSNKIYVIRRDGVEYQITRDIVSLNIQMNLDEIKYHQSRIAFLEKQIRRYKDDLSTINEIEGNNEQ